MSNNPIVGIDTPPEDTMAFVRGQEKAEIVEVGGEAPPIIASAGEAIDADSLAEIVDGPENDPTKLYPYFALTERQQEWLGGADIEITEVEKESLMHFVRENAAGGEDLPTGPTIPDLTEEELAAIQQEADAELGEANGTLTPQEAQAKRAEVERQLERLKAILTGDTRSSSLFDELRELKAMERAHARKFGRIVPLMGTSIRVKKRMSKSRKKK